jgi:hypothetical protein
MRQACGHRAGFVVAGHTGLFWRLGVADIAAVDDPFHPGRGTFRRGGVMDLGALNCGDLRCGASASSSPQLAPDNDLTHGEAAASPQI